MSLSPSLNIGWIKTDSDLGTSSTSPLVKKGNGSPSESDLSTPELGGSVSSSNGSINSPFTPINKNRIAIDNNKQQPVMAARDRPIYKQQHNHTSSNSSNESSSSTSTDRIKIAGKSAPPSVASTRRQLMPSIPMRRGSSLTTTNEANGKDGSPTNSTNASPNLGNQTNIQNLAQAIAARAQHVAAAKAALRQQQQQQQQKQQNEAKIVVHPSIDQPPSQDDSTEESSLTHSGLQPPVSIKERIDRSKSIISVADTIASDYGDEESENEDEPSTATVQRNVRPDRSDVVQSFRWSQGDWADYAAALSDQIDVGASPNDQDNQSNQGVLVAAPTAESIQSSRISTQTNPLSGLGIGVSGGSVGGGEEKENKKVDTTKSIATNPLFAQFQIKGPISTITTSQSLNAIPVEPTTPEAKSPRRKGRPNPLNLTSSISSPAMRSPSASKSLASPSMGGRTPPPTMPPSEPLPPLPVLQRKWSDRQRAHTHSSTLHAILDNAESLDSPQKRTAEEEEERSTKRSSDPSDNRSYFMRSKEGDTIPSFVAHTPTPSEPKPIVPNTITPSHLSATSIALVRANHESTLAGTDYAEAILDQVQRQPTFDEKQKANATTVQDAQPKENQEENQEGSDLDEEEAQEAVVTRVTSAVKATRASLSKAPSIIRRGTSNSSGPPSAWNASSTPTSKPSINTAVQPQVPIVNAGANTNGIPFVPARSPSAASLQGQTGNWTPTTVDTPGFDGYENPNGHYLDQRTQSGLQSRRSEMEEGVESPIERIKKTEGRFAGAFGEVAFAFKQLQAEKRALEKIIRATTPLDGLGNNGESLAEYLTTMSAKLEISSNEIQKLLDLLDQQRSVMDYMVDTHKLEIESINADMEDLKDDFDAVCEEADTHRDNAIQLTQDLDKAQHETVLARAEILRFKTSAPDARIRALEKELLDVKLQNSTLQNQLIEKKSSGSGTGSGPASPVPKSIMSDLEDIERERDLLRERNLQQEKDISELRAQIALSGGHSNDSNLLNSLPAAREDQVRLLMQQMSEQRAREAQIRKAYRQLRDDLRKIQNLNERKRPQPTYSLLSSTTTNGVQPNSATSSKDFSNEIELLNEESDQTPTPRHLKRLSLPLVNKMPTLGVPGASSTTTNASVSTAGGITPIFSKRQSKRLSVDFSAGVLPVKEAVPDDEGGSTNDDN